MESQNMQDVIDYLSNQTLDKIEETRKKGLKYLVITLEQTIVDGIASVEIKSKGVNTETEIREAINEFGISLSDPELKHKVKIYEVM